MYGFIFAKMSDFHDNLKIMQVTKLLDKTSMENLNSAAAGTQRVKCKPKPTNPKPFRLRTDVKSQS